MRRSRDFTTLLVNQRKPRSSSRLWRGAGTGSSLRLPGGLAKAGVKAFLRAGPLHFSVAWALPRRRNRHFVLARDHHPLLSRRQADMAKISAQEGDAGSVGRYASSHRIVCQLPRRSTEYCNWSLSPDGSERAIVPCGANVSTIQLRSVTTGKSRELLVKGWEGLKNIDWSADGKSLFV